MRELRQKSFDTMPKNTELIDNRVRVMNPGGLASKSGLITSSGLHFGKCWIV